MPGKTSLITQEGSSRATFARVALRAQQAVDSRVLSDEEGSGTLARRRRSLFPDRRGSRKAAGLCGWRPLQVLSCHRGYLPICRLSVQPNVFARGPRCRGGTNRGPAPMRFSGTNAPTCTGPQKEGEGRAMNSWRVSNSVRPRESGVGIGQFDRGGPAFGREPPVGPTAKHQLAVGAHPDNRLDALAPGTGTGQRLRPDRGAILFSLRHVGGGVNWTSTCAASPGLAMASRVRGGEDLGAAEFIASFMSAVSRTKATPAASTAVMS